MPIVIEIAGSSTVMSGSGRGSSGSVSVSPMVMSSKPATATMSPGPADSVGTRSSARVLSSSVMRTAGSVPSARAQATVWPLRSVPLKTRSSARRPRNGEASRFVTCACSGASSSYDGAGMCSRIVAKSGSRSSLSGSAPSAGCSSEARPALRRSVDDRARRGPRRGRGRGRRRAGRWPGRGAGRGLVDDLVDAGVGAVRLVDQEDHRELRLERLAQHEAGLRQRALARVDEQHDAVDHRQPALDLAAEVGVAGGVDHVDRDALGWPAGPVDGPR